MGWVHLLEVDNRGLNVLLPAFVSKVCRNTELCASPHCPGLLFLDDSSLTVGGTMSLTKPV